MRRIALALITGASVLGPASVASAADLARVAYKALPPPPPPPVFSWTGIYIGGHAGGALGVYDHNDSSYLGGLLYQQNLSQTITTGFLGGGQIGFNYQTGPLVWGAEAQLSWSDVSGTCAVCVFQALFNERVKTDWLSTAAARVGFALDRTIVFVKGGGAWAHNEYDASYFFPFARPDITNLHASETRRGWMFGTGVEHAFFGNWSAKVEYDYIDLGTKTVDFGQNASLSDPGVTVTHDIRQRIHLLKFGLNFRFGGWESPVAARY